MVESMLTHEAKAEIRHYLLKILLPTGGIVGLLLFGLGWAVRELGVGFAYNEAFESVQSDIVRMATEVSRSAAQVEIARQATEAAQKATRVAQRDIENAKKEALKIRDNLKIAEVSGVVGAAVERLSSDQKFVSLIGKETNTDWKTVTAKLNRSVKDWGIIRGEHGYGFQAWKHVNKMVKCPKGSYVTGIKVRYSGTCRNRCDKDGGIVREIRLTCHSVFR